VHTGRTDSISSYCDRWCERCAVTDRCAVYASGGDRRGAL